jgi:magnesium transporter
MAQEKQETARPAAASSTEKARVRTVACLGGVSLERNVPSEEIRAHIHDASNLVWMDVQDPGPAELSMLLEEFGFHPLALEDVAKGQQRPKVDEYKGYMFVVTYSVVPGKAPKEVQTLEVDLFIGRNYVVSIHRGPVPALEEAFRRWTRGGKMLLEGVGFLVYTVMDAIIDAYFPIIDAIEDEVDQSELDMFTHFRPEGIQDLLKLKRNLFALRRVLYPLRETFNQFLRRDQPMFSANTMVYFQDVYDHVLRLLDVLDIEREMVTGVLEGYLTVISNRLNATMRTLAIITVAVAIVTAVFGAYGMNFDEIPLAKEPWGFWAIAGGTIVLIVAALVFGWKRKWL